MAMTEDIGRVLAQARQERGLKLEQIAYETHIRLHYLEALESGEFHKLPSRVQAKGFLRAYAGYLDLSIEPLLAILDNKPIRPAAQKPSETQPAVTGEQISPEQDQAIFIDIGSQLKKQRELLGLSIEDVSRQTHLRDHYIRALEAGDLNSLPSPVQGRGMLQNYATFIGLDSERMLLRFAEGLQLRQSLKQHAQKKKISTRQKTGAPTRFFRFLSLDIFLGLLLVGLLVGFVVWGVFQINAMQSEPQPLPTFPSIADSLRPTPDDNEIGLVDEQTPIITEDIPLEEPVVSPTNNNEIEDDQEQAEDNQQDSILSDGDVLVHIVVRQRAWLRVTVDGTVEYEGRVSPGSAYTFSGNQLVRVYTGNGAAIEVHHNQRSLGPLGIYGEVVERVFSAEGAWTPTPSITPSPTPTLTETPTPSIEGTIEPPLPMP